MALVASNLAPTDQRPLDWWFFHVIVALALRAIFRCVPGLQNPVTLYRPSPWELKLRRALQRRTKHLSSHFHPRAVGNMRKKLKRKKQGLRGASLAIKTAA
jgi:hypothetical protein